MVIHNPPPPLLRIAWCRRSPPSSTNPPTLPPLRKTYHCQPTRNPVVTGTGSLPSASSCAWWCWAWTWSPWERRSPLPSLAGMEKHRFYLYMKKHFQKWTPTPNMRTRKRANKAIAPSLLLQSYCYRRGYLKLLDTSIAVVRHHADDAVPILLERVVQDVLRDFCHPLVDDRLKKTYSRCAKTGH